MTKKYYWKWQKVSLDWFHPSEFRHPHLMDKNFLLLMDEHRERCGFPFPVTSAARTLEEHRRLYAPNPAPDSAHPRGLAVDYRMPAPFRRIIMIREAIDMHDEGKWPYLGIEVATRHLHFENYNNPRFPRPTVWAGVSK